MNYENLVKVLADKYNEENKPDNVVECPSPLRNKKPFRPRASGTNTVLGKWWDTIWLSCYCLNIDI